MSMLVDWEIRELCEELNIVEPYNPSRVGPCSYDLSLGNSIAWYAGVEELNPEDKETYNLRYQSVDKYGVSLHPGDSVLWTTAETLKIPDNITFYIDGRSSAGRLFCDMHAASGKGDNGFHGEITLEITNKLKYRPIRLKPGMILAQMTLFKTELSEHPYGTRGRYQNESGATGSRYYQG